jgi:hypothetical protein
MISKRHFSNLTWYITHIVIFISVFILLTVPVFAKEIHYQLNKIAQLNSTQDDASQWLQLITHPNNTQQYFVINKTGKVYFVNDLDKPRQVLNLNPSNPDELSSIKLTAIELHPNFALRNQVGFGTFYTAHLEVLDKKSGTKRIQERGKGLTLKFDAVITEWQFSSIKYQDVDLNTKREVLRIAVPDNNMTIRQLSFSPFTKSWNDGFGLLYIALNGKEKWQKPLYSGVILRINPAKFGLRSFTVPSNNPFLKDSSVKDEIYLLGGQNLKQFIWSDKNSENILLSHHYNGKPLLSLIKGQNDWRDSAPKYIVLQGDSSVEDTLLYRGSLMPDLRNKLLLLMQKNQQWFIESLNIKPSINKNIAIENKPQREWQFTTQQIANNNEITFSHNRDGEVLVLDKTAGLIFQISQAGKTITAPIEKKVIISEKREESTNNIYILFIVMIVIGVGGYLLKRNNVSAKAIVRKQFAHLELSESQQQIGLYHRHNNNIDTIIDIKDITSCEVKLNNNSIYDISQEAGHGFNHEKEQYLRDVFDKEQVDKMIDGKIRQISLTLTDIHQKDNTVCLYMRKGSDRVTKKTYLVVIDDLIDWCWLIAAKINADETQTRKEKPVISSESEIDSVESKYNPTSLYKQSLAVGPTTQEPLQSQQRSEEDLPKEQAGTIELDEKREVTDHKNQKSPINTELVNALEKLVDLKQQGFLTQEEFTVAKENLLSSLFEKPEK